MGSCIVTSRRWNSRFPDAVALLRSTGAPTAELSAAFASWNTRYLLWLLTSGTGSKEANMPQNDVARGGVRRAGVRCTTSPSMRG